MTRYLGLAEFFWLAEQVTGLHTTTLVKASRVDLADSALHAPQAGYGDEDFYPDLYDKAAVRTCRFTENHPLPDGNKRAAWACLLLFVDLNDGCWDPDPPDVEEAVHAMLDVAAHKIDEESFAGWLRQVAAPMTTARRRFFRRGAARCLAPRHVAGHIRRLRRTVADLLDRWLGQASSAWSSTTLTQTRIDYW